MQDDRGLPDPGAWAGGGGASAVIVISIDGLRPDAIEAAGARTLQRLVAEGAYTLHASTVYPSRTLPSHTSMLTGVEPPVHGITWNGDRTNALGPAKVTTVFEAVEAAGGTSAAFAAKSKLRQLLEKGSPAVARVPRGQEKRTAEDVAEDAARHLRHARPDLVFAHIGEPDFAGHTFGWMGVVYRWAVRRADAAVGHIMRAADRAYGPGNYVLIVTSDHGGQGRGHGTAQLADMTIPWIAWGAGVEPGRISTEIRTTDTAATVLWLLDVPRPGTLSGRPVRDAFARVTAQADG